LYSNTYNPYESSLSPSESTDRSEILSESLEEIFESISFYFLLLLLNPFIGSSEDKFESLSLLYLPLFLDFRDAPDEKIF